MDLNNIDQQSIDKDWFFLSGEHVVFVASGGGKIPSSVIRNWDMSNKLSSFFRELPPRSGFKLNAKLDDILKGKVNKEYLRDFIFMAERGLFTFDKTHLNTFESTSYHAVAIPDNPLDFSSIPELFLIELKKTSYLGVLDEVIDIANIL